MGTKPLTSVREILNYLKESESESLVSEVRRGVPVRLPNSDWDENDPREMIDFPCSDIFLDHYHLRGLTPRHSLNYRGTRPDYKAFQFKKRGKSGGINV